jgi:hypothetical protein
MTAKRRRKPKGAWVQCHTCGGHGVYDGYDAGPIDCECNGGVIWRYPSGRLALYPGGPFCGRES